MPFINNFFPFNYPNYKILDHIVIIYFIKFLTIDFSDEIKLKLQNYSGCNDSTGEGGGSISSDDLKFTKNETIHLNDSGDFQLLCGHIMEKEGFTGEEPMRQEEDVCVLWNHVPEELTLDTTASSISYKFVMAVDIQEADVRQEIVDGKCVMCT
jgi:hypothetical protein